MDQEKGLTPDRTGLVIAALGLVAATTAGGIYFANRPPDMASACFESIKPDLKDPYSARLDSTEKVGDEVTIRYHAKNSYGAYMPGEIVCVVDSDGKVNAKRTELARSLREGDKRLKRLREENNCLAERNRLLVAGASNDDIAKAVGAQCMAVR